MITQTKRLTAVWFLNALNSSCIDRGIQDMVVYTRPDKALGSSQSHVSIPVIRYLIDPKDVDIFLSRSSLSVFSSSAGPRARIT